jgi:hypothetical protein
LGGIHFLFIGRLLHPDGVGCWCLLGLRHSFSPADFLFSFLNHYIELDVAKGSKVAHDLPPHLPLLESLRHQYGNEEHNNVIIVEKRMPMIGIYSEHTTFQTATPASAR